MHNFESVLEVLKEYKDTIDIKTIKETFNVLSKLSIHPVPFYYTVQTIKDE